MDGLKFNFEQNDLVINGGSFETAVIDSQNVALIALSQVCLLTQPQLGSQIGSRIINAKRGAVNTVLADAKRQAERDGAKDVRIILTNDGQLTFTGTYED